MAASEKELTTAAVIDAALKEPSQEVGETYEVSEFVLDKQTNAHLVRKIDRYLMPLMMMTQLLQNIDSTGLGYAAVWGLTKDLRISTEQYTWVGSMPFFGYLIFEWPMSFVAQHYHTGRVVGMVVFLWGLILMSTSITQNFAGVASVRFILGGLMSVTSPAWVLITSIFYLREEQAFRVMFWWSMNGLSLAVGGIISFCCGYISVNNIPSWKWIYIIEGGVTVIWGLIIFWVFPMSPQTARFLTPDEKKWAVARLATNKTGTKDPKIKKYQIVEALDPRKDPQGWLIFWIMFFNEFVNGGFGIFFALTLNQLGYSQLMSSVLGIPVGFSQIFWMVGAGAFTLKFSNVRILMSQLALVPTFIGFLLQIAIPEGEGRVAKTIGVCLSLGFCATFALTFQLPAQNAGGFTKRTTLTSLGFLGSSLGNIVGPHVFYEGQTPRYLTGYVCDLVCFVIQIILLQVLKWWYMRENKRRDETYGPPVAEAGDAITDLTDMENHNFRYCY